MRAFKKIRAIAFACAMLAASLPAETLVWTGAASSDWNLADANWTNELGEATAWVNGSDALFPSNAVPPVSVTDNVELHNLTLARRANEFAWSDGGGSLTFVSDGANPTNYIRFGNDTKHHDIHARVSCAGPFVKDGDAVLHLYNANNNFAGGILQTMSQMRIGPSGAVGPGAVTMLGNSTVFNVNEPIAPDVKFIQDGGSSTLLGSVGPMLTIKSVGATANNAARTFRIGRNSNACAITLALTDPESEGIGQYVFVGSSSTFTFDGGVVKASSVTKDLFFTTASSAIPAARVTNSGVTFDTAGANTDLGLSLTFDAPKAVTNVLETVTPNNWSFETGLNSSTDWRKTDQTGEASRTADNGSAFTKVGSVDYEDYYTTNGSWFVVLRRGGTISQTVSLPSSGLWRVVYERGCRPDNNYPSWEMELEVSLGDDANKTVSSTDPAMYPFRREETALFQLNAGQHLVKFVCGPHDRQNSSVYIDAVRLERCEVVTIPTGPLVKTGDGTLVVTNLVSVGPVAVSNGTLAVKGTTLDGASVDVANGGTFALYATRLTNATVNVAAGGALSLNDNFVMNGSFEDNVLEPNTFRDYGSGNGPARWRVKRLNGAQDNPGIQANGSAFSNKEGGPLTPCGSQTAYLRPLSELSQTVTVPVAGAYEVSFLHGCRYGYPSYLLSLTLFVDDVEVASNGTHSANYDFTRCSALLDLTAGEHTLRFSAGSAENRYATMLIDDVRLTSVVGLNTLDGNALAFASGSTLDLQNAEPICLVGGVTVDGVAVKGTANSLRRAGLTVIGTGSIQIGPPQGTVILFK